MKDNHMKLKRVKALFTLSTIDIDMHALVFDRFACSDHSVRWAAFGSLSSDNRLADSAG